MQNYRSDSKLFDKVKTWQDYLTNKICRLNFEFLGPLQ